MSAALLTRLAAALLALQLIALAWLWSTPMPDDSEIPGRAPLYDVGVGGL